MNAPSRKAETAPVNVLIVEDDDQVRHTLMRMLGQAGFTVTGADNGLSALAALRQHEYQVILCDMQMPFLEGRRLFDELRVERPDLARRVVFVTGNAEDPEVRRFLAETGRPVVLKPVTGALLAGVVRDVAEGHAPRAGGRTTGARG